MNSDLNKAIKKDEKIELKDKRKQFIVRLGD